MLNKGPSFTAASTMALVAAPPVLVWNDSNTRATILNAIAQRLGREACKYNRVEGANTSTGEAEEYLIIGW